MHSIAHHQFSQEAMNHLLSGDLGELQDRLFDEGLIQFVIDDAGLSIELTKKGHSFSNQSEVRTQSSTLLRKPRQTLSGHLVLAGFILTLLICFLLA